jgi:hypothetical protein
MTWGREAVETLFGGPRRCDLCLDPALAFHAGWSRCEAHLTEEMRGSRPGGVSDQARSSSPGGPQEPSGGHARPKA